MKKKTILVSLLVILFFSMFYMILGTNFLSLPEYEMWRQTISLEGDLEEGENYFDIENSNVYVDVSWIKNHNIADLSWDEKNQVLTYFDGKNIYRFYKNGQAKKNKELVNFNQPIVKRVGDSTMISASFLETKEYHMFEYQKDLNRLIVYDTSSLEDIKRAHKFFRVRSSKNYFSNTVDIVAENEIYKVKSNDEWLEIITARGIKGYINENALDTQIPFRYIRNLSKTNPPIGIESIRIGEKEEPYQFESREEIINMTWNHFVSKTPDTDKLKAQKGIDIISPTWFSLNENLSIRDIGTNDYMNWAKRNGYEVWILFANGFDPKRTSKLVNDSSNREMVIENIIEKTLAYGAKGINIDFENIYYEDKDMLTQFVKELYVSAKANNLVLSMDVTFISQSENWSKCYDRKELQKYLDYMVIMAYDEYWAGRKEAGPVASIPWVDNNIQKIIEEVPNSKLILGGPFYTRLWKENLKTGEITSSAYTMMKTDDFVKRNNIDVVFDEKNQLDYAELIYKDVSYKIWIENFESIDKRIKIINKYDLQGFASWRKGFEKEEVWGYIHEKLKTSD